MPTSHKILIGLVIVAAISFLAGVDDRMNQIDEANRLDRLRLYCALAGHSETMCYHVKPVKEDANAHNN